MMVVCFIENFRLGMILLVLGLCEQFGWDKSIISRLWPRWKSCRPLTRRSTVYPICMPKCPWARYWTPHFPSLPIHPLYECVCVNERMAINSIKFFKWSWRLQMRYIKYQPFKTTSWVHLSLFFVLAFYRLQVLDVATSWIVMVDPDHESSPWKWIVDHDHGGGLYFFSSLLLIVLFYWCALLLGASIELLSIVGEGSLTCGSLSFYPVG